MPDYEIINNTHAHARTHTHTHALINFLILCDGGDGCVGCGGVILRILRKKNGFVKETFFKNRYLSYLKVFIYARNDFLFYFFFEPFLSFR